jgi:DNA-binding Lrp family transcriptional regulator
MPTAYIFTTCQVGDENKIINEISKVPEIKEVRGTYGVHDIFAKIRAPTEVINNIITQN